MSHFAGDAFFSLCELNEVSDAANQGIGLAVDAAARVSALAPAMAIRDPDDSPIRMGWGVVVGWAAVGPLGGGGVSVMGDATNLAFRLAGTAGRHDQPDVLVTDEVCRMAEDAFMWTDPIEVSVKGREGTETVYGVRPSAS